MLVAIGRNDSKTKTRHERPRDNSWRFLQPCHAFHSIGTVPMGQYPLGPMEMFILLVKIKEKQLLGEIKYLGIQYEYINL